MKQMYGVMSTSLIWNEAPLIRISATPHPNKLKTKSLGIRTHEKACLRETCEERGPIRYLSERQAYVVEGMDMAAASHSSSEHINL